MCSQLEVLASTFHVVNLGCKVNRVESDTIELNLIEAGFLPVNYDEASIIVINTCAVTGEAEAKTRQAIRKALKQRAYPHVFVTGCAINLSQENFEEYGERVFLNTDKLYMAEFIAKVLGCPPLDSNEGETRLAQALKRKAERRVAVKVQDGCDNRCTYCVVWKARGKSRSIPLEKIEDQVRTLAGVGVQEIVLTGINLGKFASRKTDQHQNYDLVDLLKRLLDTPIARLRISSIEPQDVSDELIELMAHEDTRICSHLHLPLQSGDDRVLSAMGRSYTVQEFEMLSHELQKAMPQIALTTDIIAGFPGETQDEHENTIDLIKRIGFSKLHVFKFSARPGTVAASLEGQLSPETISSRAKELRELGASLRLADAQARVGTQEYILIERDDKGTSASYHQVIMQDEDQQWRDGELILADLIGCDDRSVLMGRLAKS